MINFNVQIRHFPFNAASQGLIESWKNGSREYGANWPVVYMIHNDKTHMAYVGETLNAGRRAAQHWSNPERQCLSTIHIMTDDTFNKSVILDLESFLIRYISADRTYTLQNSNAGLADFDYFNRKEYEKEFQKIWGKLKESGLVKTNIADIQDSDFFKYSPYKALTIDQQDVLSKILYIFAGYLKRNLETSIVVVGGPGTGKTILAIYLLKLLCDLKNNAYDQPDAPEGTASETSEIQSILKHRELKIGFIVPQQSLRGTIKKVLNTIHGMSDALVLTPLEAARIGKDEPFDLLLCDEAHRLHRRYGLSQYASYDNMNRELGLPADATELDWIIHSSRMQLLFYDSDQSVRPSDITSDMFRQVLSSRSVSRLQLRSQLRCLGGDDYIRYVHDVLETEGTDLPVSGSASAVMHENPLPWVRPSFENYSMQFYNDLDMMMDEINRLNQKHGLCCAVAGYGWKWATKDEPADTALRDITVGRGYIWNRTNTDWINSDRLPNEIGCIHTVQGYDLNYVGVIFGPEIIYDKKTHRIEVVKKNYFDSLGKAVGDDLESLRTYILNIYATLLTRGIRGVLVYVCDPDLREYLRPYFQS